MSTTTYVAGMFAAVLWGAAPVVSKRGLSYGGNPWTVTIIVVSTGLVLLWSLLLVRNGPAALLPALSPRGYAIFLCGGIVGTALGRITNYTGIDRVGASLNSAMIATNPLWATILAFVFLQEAITYVQAAGIVIVVVGLVALTLSKGGDLSGWSRRDLVFPLIGAFAFGSGGVIRRFGLTTTGASPIEGAALNGLAAFSVLGGYVLVGHRSALERIPLRAFGYFVATGMLSSVGLLMLFTGLETGRVAIVSTLVGTSTLFATAFSYVFLGDLERVTKGIAGGVALVVTGVIMVTLP